MAAGLTIVGTPSNMTITGASGSGTTISNGFSSVLVNPTTNNVAKTATYTFIGPGLLRFDLQTLYEREPTFDPTLVSVDLQSASITIDGEAIYTFSKDRVVHPWDPPVAENLHFEYPCYDTLTHTLLFTYQRNFTAT